LASKAEPIGSPQQDDLQRAEVEIVMRMVGEQSAHWLGNMVTWLILSRWTAARNGAGEIVLKRHLHPDRERRAQRTG